MALNLTGGTRERNPWLDSTDAAYTERSISGRLKTPAVVSGLVFVHQPIARRGAVIRGLPHGRVLPPRVGSPQ